MLLACNYNRAIACLVILSTPKVEMVCKEVGVKPA